MRFMRSTNCLLPAPLRPCNDGANEAAAGKGHQSVLNKGAKRVPELYMGLDNRNIERPRTSRGFRNSYLAGEQR